MFGFFKDVYLVLSGRDDLGDRFDTRFITSPEARKAAARFSRGSVAIQAGSFVTVDQLNHERLVTARYRFAKK